MRHFESKGIPSKFNKLGMDVGLASIFEIMLLPEERESIPSFLSYHDGCVRVMNQVRMSGNCVYFFVCIPSSTVHPQVKVAMYYIDAIQMASLCVSSYHHYTDRGVEQG